MHAQIVVLQLPPKDSVKSLVSFESRKGTKFRGLFEASAETQFDRAAIDLFMFLASWSLSPSLPVLLSLSEPARSTMVNRAFLYTRFLLSFYAKFVSTHFCSTKIYKMACDRLELLFMPVWFTARLFMPCATYYKSCSFVLMWTWVKPSTKIPVFGSSLICRFCDCKELVERLVDYYRIGLSDLRDF